MIQYSVLNLAETVVATFVDVSPVDPNHPGVTFFGKKEWAGDDWDRIDDLNNEPFKVVNGIDCTWYHYFSSDDIISVEEKLLVLAEINNVPMDQIKLLV